MGEKDVKTVSKFIQKFSTKPRMETMELVRGETLFKGSSKKVKVGGNRCDRYIPVYACSKAYKVGAVTRKTENNQLELVPDESSSPRVSSPEFFHNLRQTGHYQAVDGNRGHDAADANVDTDTNDGSGTEVVRLCVEKQRHRKIIADSLGFLMPERVYVFNSDEKLISNNISHGNTGNNNIASSSNHFTGFQSNLIKVDPLLTILPPEQVMKYLASKTDTETGASKSKTTDGARVSKRVKSHIPYRVLDAPCLRNDFYSNLVSWSRTTNNVIVGLGCSVYIWSDTQGAILVFDHNYLQHLHDLVTCVSFCPNNSYFIVGTKKGRLLLFDQDKCIRDHQNYDFPGKPLHEYQSPMLRGISCAEWYMEKNKSQVLVGEESGDISVLTIIEPKIDVNDIYNDVLEKTDLECPTSIRNPNCLQNDTFNSINHKSGYELQLISRFQAQSQQVCAAQVLTNSITGISLNESDNLLAVGGNDNSCTIWSLKEIENPKLLHNLYHKAAVKAVAFCPWSKSLLATGGGSKDRTIKFWHAKTGTLLGQIETTGQITALIWSTRYKQIVATFGFGQAENPVLVTLYSYPTFEPLLQVKSPVPFRILSAVPSPTFTSICVATNDETIRFYELWNDKEAVIQEAQHTSLFGSNIIEFTEGIETNTEAIR